MVPGGVKPLAGGLNNLSSRLSDAGRHEEGLAAITEGVRLPNAELTPPPEGCSEKPGLVLANHRPTQVQSTQSLYCSPGERPPGRGSGCLHSLLARTANGPY